MLSDEVLEKVTERIVERIEAGNIYVMKKIGNDIKKIRSLTPTEADQLVQTLKYGGDYNKIVKKLAEISELTEKDIKEIFEEVAKSDYKFAKQFYEYRGIGYVPYNENITLKNQVDAIANITSRRIANMIKPRVLGIGTINKKTGKVVIKTLKKAYYELLDEAVLNVSQGKETFDQAMSRQIKAMGGGGLKAIYKDGYTRRLDSTIRMNLKDSLLDLNNEVQAIFAKQYGADGVEISVHSFPAPDHAEVQGKQFSYEQFENFQNDETATSYDGIVFEPEHDGHDRRSISQYNCYHKPFNIVLGVSKPEYSNEQLKAIIDRNNEGFEIDGKHYTTYEGLQMQRSLETKIRQQKDIQIMAREGGQDDLVMNSQQKITQLTQKYRELSKASGLPTKMERMKVSGYKRTKVNIPKKVKSKDKFINLTDNDFAKMENTTKEIMNKLNEKEIKSLGNYTLKEYKDINSVLAQPDINESELITYNTKEEVWKDINNIDSAIRKSTIDDNITVYKGTASNYFENFSTGDEFEMPIYYSTTGKESIALDKFMRNISYQKGKNPAILEIKVPKGTNGLYMGDLFNENGLNEYEILLNRNLKYKIADIKEIDTSGYNEDGIYTHGTKYKKITLEVVNDNRRKVGNR